MLQAVTSWSSAVQTRDGPRRVAAGEVGALLAALLTAHRHSNTFLSCQAAIACTSAGIPRRSP